MASLYWISVTLHVLAAITWVGGIAFLVLVVVPWLHGGGQQIAGTFLRETGERFRAVGWIAFAVLLVTGTFNLFMRGVRLESFTDPAWLGSPFGKAVMVKLLVFFAILATSAVHDFVVGPAATRAIVADPTSPDAAALRKRASYLGRLNAIFALLAVATAVTLVRGTPW